MCAAIWNCTLALAAACMAATNPPAQETVEPPAPVVLRLVNAQKGLPILVVVRPGQAISDE
jgi:hypothetical protein